MAPFSKPIVPTHPPKRQHIKGPNVKCPADKKTKKFPNKLIWTFASLGLFLSSATKANKLPEIWGQAGLHDVGRKILPKEACLRPTILTVDRRLRGRFRRRSRRIRLRGLPDEFEERGSRLLLDGRGQSVEHASAVGLQPFLPHHVGQALAGV